ncbi:hypothetical protein JCM21900_004804 [Sporobolomyces salmonicolor]
MPPITRSRTARKAAAPYEKRTPTPKQRSPVPALPPPALKRSRDDDDDSADLDRHKKGRHGSKPTTTAAQEAPVDKTTAQEAAKNKNVKPAMTVAQEAPVEKATVPRAAKNKNVKPVTTVAQEAPVDKATAQEAAKNKNVKRSRDDDDDSADLDRHKKGRHESKASD